MTDWKRIWREWIWDWNIAKPYFAISLIGIAAMVVCILVALLVNWWMP